MNFWNNQTINQVNDYDVFTSLISKKTFKPIWWRLPTFSNNLRSPKSSLFTKKVVLIFDDVFLLFRTTSGFQSQAISPKKMVHFFDKIFPLFQTTWGLQYFHRKKMVYIIWSRLTSFMNNTKSRSKVISPGQNVRIFWWRLSTFFYKLKLSYPEYIFLHLKWGFRRLENILESIQVEN